MKHIIALLIFLTSISFLKADEGMENDFIGRISAFVDSEDMRQDELKKIWFIGDTPPNDVIETFSSLELVVLKKIDKIEFLDLYPGMAKSIEDEIFNIDGSDFTANMKPYKFVKIYYKKEIKGAGFAFQTVTGIRDGTIYILGMKKL